MPSAAVLLTYINKDTTLRQETNMQITLILYRKHTPMKLKWKQYTSCGIIICGIRIRSTDCTGSSKIKRRNILQSNSLSINTVIRSSLYPHNLNPSSCCGKLKNEKKKKRWRNGVQFRILHLTQVRNNRTQKEIVRNKDADLVRQQRLQSCVIYTYIHMCVCVCACVLLSIKTE
jgi:hypothetical protein